MKLIVKGKVWIYPGLGGWHFVNVDKTISERLRYPDGVRVRKGLLPVVARVGKTEWRTSLFPTKEGSYILSIKSSVRVAEGIMAGDTVSVRCTLI